MGLRMLVGPIPRELRTLAYVPRWSIIRVNRVQSVCEHSFMVACYASLIYGVMEFQSGADIPDEGDLLSAALAHDIEEVVTGDIPSPAHRAVKEGEQFKASIDGWLRDRFQFVEMSENQSVIASWIIKAADYLDALFYLNDELQSGNTHCKSIYLDMRRWAMAFFNTAYDQGWMVDQRGMVNWLLNQIDDNVERIDRVVA